MRTCDLSCENGGYCTPVTGDGAELSNRAAAGYLLEKCVCRPGYGGTACEQIIDECSVVVDDNGVERQRTCHSGVPCKRSTGIDDGSEARYECDCGAAEAVSRFAYEMCRRPATEYCGLFDSAQSNSFCTNGGSCASNLGIQIEDKGPFEHEGCVCPPEFHGPHCEYLVGYGPSGSYGGRMQPSSTSVFNVSRHGPGSVFITMMILFGVGAMVVLIAVAAYQRHRRRRDLNEMERKRDIEQRELPLREDPDNAIEEKEVTMARLYSDVPPPQC
mmetsp:Transcript_23479/g.43427  ORF Transcript_23479/g.43427 Transcript_23479/m.43427 type:complete len:273 (-) Transcript_23479:164-982(-)